MTNTGSVTIWLDQLKKDSHDEAVTQLWDKYFARLVRLARQRLYSRPRTVADEEDIALAAFDSFIRRAQAGSFPKLDDRDDLWNILFTLTTRKAANLVTQEKTQKKGSGNVVPLSALENPNGQGLDEADSEPNPHEAIAMAESLDELLAALPTDEYRRIAVWKLEQYTNAEIATKLDRAETTVELKLKRIREHLKAAGYAPAP